MADIKAVSEVVADLYEGLAELDTELNIIPALARRLGRNARREYEAKYTEEENYRQIMRIYSAVIETARN